MSEQYHDLGAVVDRSCGDNALCSDDCVCGSSSYESEYHENSSISTPSDARAESPVIEDGGLEYELIETLRNLWADILNINPTSITSDDTFIGLGGESLAAIRLVSAAARQGFSLDVASIFKYPRLSDLAPRLQPNSAADLELPSPFSLLGLDVSLEELAQCCGLPVHALEDAYPCTPMQEGLIYPRDQDAATYIGSAIVRLPRRIDWERLTHAWRCVLAAHSILRTRIVETSLGKLFQVVVKDTSETPGDRRIIEHSVLDVQTEPMGLGTTLCRCHITRDKDSAYLSLSMHHTIYDGWTLPRLGAEFFKAYRGVRLSQSLPFSVYISRLDRQPAAARYFWTSRLSRSDRTSMFPTISSPLGAGRADSVAEHRLPLTTNTQIQFSVPTILQAAWALLASRMISSDDVTFGTVVSGRNIPIRRIESLLSPAISTVPFRVKFNDSESVARYLERVQAQIIEAIPYETFGLQNIRKLGRDARVCTRFNTLLIVQTPKFFEPEHFGNLSPAEYELKDQLENLDLSTSLGEFNDFPLMVIVDQRERGLVIKASYHSTQFESAQMRRLLAQFAHVFQQLIEPPNFDSDLSTLNLMTNEDKALIRSWNSGLHHEFRSLIHQIIEDSSRSRPAAPAVCAWDGEMSYADLDVASQRLCQRLRHAGITSGDLVPIFMEKSKWTAVAMLSILRAGAAFLLMDIINQPESRLRIMIQESSAKLVLTAGAATATATKFSKEIMICDENGEADSSSTGPTSDVTPPSPADVAFVIYTSGSTGLPKGIQITHANFCSTIKPHQDQLQVGGDSRIFDYASYSFDIAVHNALLTFASGACLCIPSEHDRLNDIEGSIRRLNANWMNLTNSVANMIDPTAVPGIRTLVQSGEPLSGALVSRWAGKVNLINAYGPAETQICTIQQNIKDSAQASRIGVGIACSTWVVDPVYNSLLPIGAVGELVVQGPIVSPGYLAESSSSAFLVDASWLPDWSHDLSSHSDRLYRTGDLVRYQSDGTLDYVGRIGTQVKVHGQRVDLAGIESHMQSIMGRSETVVVDSITLDDDQIICSFTAGSHFLPASNHSDQSLPKLELTQLPSTLLDELQRLLPAYMIPKAHFRVSHMPLTTSRKADRRYLRTLAARLSREEIFPSATRNLDTHSFELKQDQGNMIAAWSSSLKTGVENIDLNSDFYQLGGDSMSAMRLVQSAREHGLVFTVSQVLRYPRLQDLLQEAGKCARKVDVELHSPEVMHAFDLCPEPLQNQLIAAATQCKAPSDDILDIYPCSPFQEAVLAETFDDASAYVQHLTIGLPHQVRLGNLLAAWDSVISRNAILRTRIVQSDDGKLRQVVLRETGRWPRFQDTSVYLDECQKHPMGIGTPLSQFCIVDQVNAQPKPGRTLIWSMHHAIYDSVTVDLLLREVVNQYHGRHTVSPITEYKVFIRYLQAQKQESRKWWRTRLAGAAHSANFPKAVMSHAVERSTKSTVHAEYSMPHQGQLGFTTAMLLRCAWAALMSRQTGGEAILFGEMRLGRGVAVEGIANIRGPTISPVPILAHVDRECSIRKLLDSMAEMSIQLLNHEQYGIQNIAQIDRHCQAACSFRTILVIQDSNRQTTVEDEVFQIDETIDDIRNFNSWDLMVIVKPGKLTVEYDVVFRELSLDIDAVRILVQQLHTFFEKLSQTPLDTKVAALDIATDAEVDKIWHMRHGDLMPITEFLHDVISRRAQTNPHNLAVDSHDSSMTYDQLDERSSRLAAQLVARGVGPGDFIPICLEKSSLVPLSILAVMKSGAAFCALDVSQPTQRLRQICSVLGATMVLTSFTQLDLSKELASERIVVSMADLSNDSGTIQPYSGWQNDHDSTLPMYVCFTSGSTGVPKGVVVSHRNMASSAVRQAQELDFVPEDRVYDFSSHSFDANIWETWMALVAGSCLCIPSETDRNDNLTQSIISMGVTKLGLTPSVARALDPSDLPTVQKLFLWGEAITPLDVHTWTPHAELWCGYGPTELTPLCTFTQITRPECAANLGKPISAKHWIVDPNDYHRLASIGAVGELLVEGPVVALGYLGQPEITARAFVRDPNFLVAGSSQCSGRSARLYRTGDLVRYCRDGMIEYVGRADQQVKLRGQRIEFGEIEFHLKALLPADSSFVCDVVTHSSGRPMLVCFYTEQNQGFLQENALKAHLSKILPVYMVPEAFLAIPAIPQNTSGKTNRKALKALALDLLAKQRKTTEEQVKPQYGPCSKAESVLLELWIKALGIPGGEIHRDSNFFDMGADSITTMKLSSLAQRNNLKLTMRDIVKNPQLWAMALGTDVMRSTPLLPAYSLIEHSSLESTIENAAQVCEAKSSEIEDMYPCTPLQLELFASTLKSPTAYIHDFVFECPNHVNFEKLVRAWDRVIELNPILRTRFVQDTSAGLIQVVFKRNPVHVNINHHVKSASAPLRVDLGLPLSRVVAEDNEQIRRITWSIHHALYDGWSVQIIDHQLRQAYAGQEIHPSPGFNLFVQQIMSHSTEAAADFWRTYLEGCERNSIFPSISDRSQSVRPTEKFIRHLRVDPALINNLQSTVHAAWALVISKITNADDVLFAATLSGRDSSLQDIETAVGPTIAPVPIRIQIKGSNQTTRKLVSSMEQTRAALPDHAHVGMRTIEALGEHARIACQATTLIVIMPPEIAVDEHDVATSNRETWKESHDPFHTYALVLFFTPVGRRLRLDIIFDGIMLSQRELERMSGRLERIILSFGHSGSQDTRLDTLCHLAQEDLDDLQKWNENLPPAQDCLLDDTIIRQAKRMGTKIAIDAWDHQISYNELDKLSSAIAYNLLQHGVRRGSAIPLLIPKSAYMSIAAIAVLRTGASFVPLDVTLPSHRLGKIIDQLHAPVMIYTASVNGIANSLSQKLFALEDNMTLQSTQNDISLDLEQYRTPEDIACILFTSGTTGTPKGVLLSHTALSSAVFHQSSRSELNEDVRTFEFASYGFDVSWNLIFKTLAVGGTLCVPSEEQRQNDLAGSLIRSGATLTELTASVARLLDPALLTSLSVLILSGEPVDIRQFEHWMPKVRLLICYGPSECTSVSTMTPCIVAKSQNPGIGKAAACRTWIVDPDNHLCLVPIGAIGEILIEGPIVGSGYFGNKELTASSFVTQLPSIKDAVGTARPGYGFKSGDLAFYDTEGSIHFVSRKDTQIKIRGQRIELAEVEHQVQSIMQDLTEGVVACVTQSPNKPDRQQLCAFLRLSTNTTANNCDFMSPSSVIKTEIGSLKDKLSLILPSYMVPTRYYCINNIPHTTNGKVDRRRLTTLAESATGEQCYTGAPEVKIVRSSISSPAEIELRKFWAESLGLKETEIGANDSFFALNGDSISAIRMVALARSRGHELAVTDVFQAPMLSALAAKLRVATGNQAIRLKKHNKTDYRVFGLLGNDVDEIEMRRDLAQKCAIKDISLIEDAYPCTPLQTTMMAATVQNPQAFASTRIFRIDPQVDLQRLRDAWDIVVARNQILRTRIVDQNDRGLVQVAVHGQAPWQHYESMGKFLQNTGRRESSFGTPLTEFAIIETGTERQLIWEVHHTLYDGWTLPLIEAEVADAYRGKSLGPPGPGLKPLVSYIMEQDKHLSINFWAGALAGATSGMAFPSQSSRPLMPASKGFFEKDLEVDLSSLPSTLTLPTTLLGSWALLMTQMTGNSRTLVGNIVTGREVPVSGIDTMVGPAITVVPWLINADSNTSANAFVEKLREDALARVAHQHLGITDIRRINEDTAAACDFQTVMVIQPRSNAKPGLDKSPWASILQDMDETKFEGLPDQHGILNQYGLMLEVLPFGQRTLLRVSFDHNAINSHFAERVVQRWEACITKFINVLRNTPSIALGSVKHLDGDDLNQIWSWNEHLPVAMSDSFAHAAVSEVASMRPNALAIDAWDGRMTFVELEQISDRLAERIIDSGVPPGSFVPFIFRKSMWANVAMLAILKAGAAFVPLDADHPEGRLRAVTQELKPLVILCSAETMDRAGRLAPNALLVDESIRIGNSVDNNSGPRLSYGKSSRPRLSNINPSQALAYAMFTSGSTGSAKGVKITHQNLLTAVRYQSGGEAYGINAESRTLDSSSYSFDACVCNFFYTVLQGGCLCVPREDTLKGDVGTFIDDFKVNWAQLVPSSARTINPERVPTLKSLVLTGEPIARDDIEQWSRRLRLINAYGPTECTILCSVSPPLNSTIELSNIGRGKGANLWLTEIGNPDQLVPVGAVGEILIEGPLIGAGYLGGKNYPLVEDPAWLLAGAPCVRGRRGRLYRTGDKARYTDDGTLVFAGRVGSEIKLRGQKLDIADIEGAVRRTSPSLREIAVEIVSLDRVGNGTDSKTLVLYVAATSASLNTFSGDPTQVSDRQREANAWLVHLRALLADIMPSYSQPEAAIVLPTLFKTSSGKIDRKRLREHAKLVHGSDVVWASSSNTAVKSKPLPSTQNERQLAQLWSRVLGLPINAIASDDDFFSLGGDSLGVMRLTTLANQHGLSLSSSQVFKGPKLAELAEHLVGCGPHSTPLTNHTPFDLAPELLNSGGALDSHLKDIFGVTCDQVEDILPANGFQIDYMHSEEEPFGIQYAYIDLHPGLSWQRLIEACRHVVDALQCLRARFIHFKGRYFQVILHEAPMLIEQHRTDTQMTTFFNSFCANDRLSVACSDVLTKVALLQAAQGQRRAVFRLSHMQNDGWCTIQIFKTIQTVYNGGPILRTHDWSRLTSYRRQNDSMSERYWRSVLKGTDSMTPPLIFRPDESGSRTLRTIMMPSFQSARNNRRTRPAVVVNVAWALVLQQMLGHNDVVFGNVTTGRNGDLPGIEDVIGPCVNMLPFRLQLAPRTDIATRRSHLLALVDASASQVDERSAHEGMNWDDMVDRSTTWPRKTRYASAVHYRNMEFEPHLTLDGRDVTIAWCELVATPKWTTILVHPEEQSLRIWVLAAPDEIGQEGADELLGMLAGYIGEILEALRDDRQ